MATRIGRMGTFRRSNQRRDPRPRYDPFKHRFQAADIIAEAELFADKAAAALAHFSREGFISEQLFNARGELSVIKVRDEEAVLAVEQPLANAAGVKSNDGEATAHGFQAGGAERFRPKRTHDRQRSVAIIGWELLGWHIALEVDLALKPKRACQAFAPRALVAVTEDDALEIQAQP